MFKVGVRYGMEKVAIKGDVEELVVATIQQHLPPRKQVSSDDDLETLLPDDGDMEGIIASLEEKLDVQLESDDVFALFAEGTVADLVQAFTTEILEKKAAYSHTRYVQNRQQNIQRQRVYRMRNLHQIRRKSRIYRKRVARRSHRPRKRIGSAAGGFSFIAR